MSLEAAILAKLNQGGSSQTIDDLLAKLSAIDAGTAANTSTTDLDQLNILFGSATGMTMVAASTTAMNAVTASTTAMNAVTASTTAMNAVIASVTAMNAVAASAIAMNAVAKVFTANTFEAALQSRQTSIEAALADATNFIKTSVNVGNGAGTFIHGAGTNTFYIPRQVSDDGDTAYIVNSNSTGTQIMANVAAHSGLVAAPWGVAKGGVNVVGTGASVGYVQFDVYTAI